MSVARLLPLKPGIITSSTTTLGLLRITSRVTPNGDGSATTLAPHVLRNIRVASNVSGLSSTTRTVTASRDNPRSEAGEGTV